MLVYVYYNGEQFISEDIKDEIHKEELISTLYNLPNINILLIPLSEGGKLLLGKQAIQSSVFLIYGDEDE